MIVYLRPARGGTRYLFGSAAEYILGDLWHYEEILFAAILVVGLAYWWFSRRRKR